MNKSHNTQKTVNNRKHAFGRRLSSLVSCILILSFLTSLTGCFDLGMFEDGAEEGYADYYAAFGDVYTVSESGIHDYDVKDSLFNETTINELRWENEDDKVKEEAYTFIAIPVEKDMNIELVSFYLRGDVSTDLEVFAYRVSGKGDIPSLLFYDETGEEDEEEEDDEDDDEDKPDPTVSVLSLDEADGSAVWHVEPGAFTSGSISFGKGDNALKMEDGDLLLLYVTNNTRFGFFAGKQRCYFTFLNMLVRAVKDSNE